MTRRLAVLCLLSFAAIPGAAAQTPPAQPANVDDVAKVHYERGLKLFKQDRFVDALAEFAAGYEISRRPLFLFNMGECARLAGHANAREYYQRYLAADPSGALADLARKRLVALDQSVQPGATKPAAPAPVAPKPEIGTTTSPPPDVPTKPSATGSAPQIPSPAQAAKDVPPSATKVEAGPAELSPAPRWWQRWPIWAAVGGVVVGGTITAYAVTRDRGCSGSCTTINLRD